RRIGIDRVESARWVSVPPQTAMDHGPPHQPTPRGRGRLQLNYCEQSRGQACTLQQNGASLAKATRIQSASLWGNCNALQFSAIEDGSRTEEVRGVSRRNANAVTHDLTISLYLVMHYGDLTDATNLIRLIQEHQPDEIYNLAPQSHVAVSFETPEYTANADALGTLRLLEAIRILGIKERTRFYQASTSEL